MNRERVMQKGSAEKHYFLFDGRLICHSPIQQRTRLMRITATVLISWIIIGIFVFAMTEANEATLTDLQRFGAASDCHADSLYANGKNSWKIDVLDAISRDCEMVAGVIGRSSIDDSSSP